MKFENCSCSARFLGYAVKSFNDQKGVSHDYLVFDFYDDNRIISITADFKSFEHVNIEEMCFHDVTITVNFTRKYISQRGAFSWSPRVVDMALI